KSKNKKLTGLSTNKNEPTRPSDEEVERLFLNMMRKLDLGSLSDKMLAMPVENKWKLVQTNMITETERKINSVNSKPVQNTVDDPNTPEYYLKKIMDGSITCKQLNSLSIFLRTLPIT
ncbi:32579_t:CDS:2, partial [Racocetra persica]